MSVRTSALVVFAASLLTLGAAVPAQTTAPECQVEWVGSRPMVRAKLRAGDKTYLCHLLIDLAFPQALLLHRNAAGSLRAEACDVEIGSIRLAGVPFEGKRERFLEALTARFATELHEVPVAGILGLPAFAGKTVELDGPGRRLTLTIPPPDSTGTELAGELASGLAIDASLGGGKTARFRLATRNPESFAAPSLLHELGAKGGVLQSCRAAGVDFAQSTPFRAQDADGDARGGFGGRVLQSCVVLLDLEHKRTWIRQPQQPEFPAGEAALCKALAEGESALLALLGSTTDPAAREEAARVLFEALHKREPLDVQKLEQVARTLVELAPVERRASTALDLVKDLPEDALGTREMLAKLALPNARQDQNGEAQHALRVELGRAALARGDLDAAYQALLSAVFGMPGQGEPALLLGRVHEKKGELERARARYFQALLDSKNTGEQGFEALLALHEKQGQPQGTFAASLLPMAEGRVPALHPVPREPEEIKKTGRVALVELFTGAQCPPCVAADLAVDGLAERYDRDEVAIVVWHLPIPGPEPMITSAGMARAKALGVRGTPTVRIDGEDVLPGGGDQDAAVKMLDRYEKALAPRLLRPKSVELVARAQRTGKSVRCEVTATGAFASARVHAVLLERLLAYAGRNGIVFHPAVVRAELFGGEGEAIASGTPVVKTLDLDAVAAELQGTIEGVRRNGKPFCIEPSTVSDAIDLVVWIEDASGKVLQAATVPLGPDTAAHR